MKRKLLIPRLFLSIILLTAFISNPVYAENPVETDQVFDVYSPSGDISVKVEVDEFVTYSVSYKGFEVLTRSPISMKLDNGINLGKDAKISKSKTISVTEEIIPVVKQKSAIIADEYNQLKIDFEGNYSLYFRAYDDGVAYRWEVNINEPYKVISELASFVFNEDHKIWFPEEESFLSHQERTYSYINLSEISPDRFCSTGTLVDYSNGMKMYISESDLEGYPGMFLRGSETDSFALQGLFAGYPLQTEQESDRTVRVTEYADYIAKVQGKKKFPWRLMVLTTDDSQLLTTQMVYKLAKPLQLDDVSWIKPGKVAWDWWNNNNIYGVDFEAGINTDTYKYFIDFASSYNIEYIILDEGWYHLEDALKVKDGIDVKELIHYGKSKNVGIILWVTWKALYDNMEEVLNDYQAWGAKGIKVDFMQRDDQWMVEYYHTVAREAAERHLLVDFHGAYKPAGLRRAYPNVITREAVQGLEHCKWSENSDPEHNVTLPFIRQVAGPMDYTPGAMINANLRNFRDIFSAPMSPGTRCHQLAMYVVFESPLQMLADNPSNYYREPECMQFLSAVPSVWDETKIIKAKVSDYIVTARRNGDAWYLGAMTDWSPRNFTIKLDFLGEGAHTIEIWKDGANAHRHASDYKYISLPVDKTSEIEIKLAPGGGWVAIITKDEYLLNQDD